MEMNVADLDTTSIEKELEDAIVKLEEEEEKPKKVSKKIKKATKKDSQVAEEGLNPETMKLMDIPGLGPKTAKALEDGGIESPAQLLEIKLSRFDELGIARTMGKKIRASVVNLFPEKYADFNESYSLEDIEGIGPTTAKALREKGMNFALLETTPVRELEARYGITANTAQKYQAVVIDTKGGFFTDAFAIMNKQQSSRTVTFGADSVDNLFSIPELNSTGLREGETYEFFGAFRSGKSQLCHQICVTVQLPEEKGGLGKKAIFLDTEGTFSPSRLTQIATRIKLEKNWDKSVEDILKDIVYARVKNSDSQQAIAHKLLEYLGNRPGEFGLLVLDSVSAHFRAEYAGRGTLAERQQTLNYHLSILHRIADTYGLIIAVTNQVQSNPAQFFGDPTNAVGGNIMGHWAGTRCYLRKSKGERRIIKIYDSPVLPENEAVFEITESGVMSSE
ncbi:MAG: DNA repair and recombination protein RadA [Candidatus Heimdallarchaeota archaeon LC_2]|nr:MAG: DNA repair and recombination protein RadA [Candidatus Heimdallarchaeota archaeon LC_2]